MGLQSTGAGTVYLSIQGGKIARRVAEPTATSKSRQIESTGRVVNEELYDSLEGHLSGVSVKEGTFGKELHVFIAEDQKYDLQLMLSSGPAKSFLSALPNVDLSKPVRIIPKMEVKDGVSRTKILHLDLIHGRHVARVVLGERPLHADVALGEEDLGRQRPARVLREAHRGGGQQDQVARRVDHRRRGRQPLLTDLRMVETTARRLAQVARGQAQG